MPIKTETLRSKAEIRLLFKEGKKSFGKELKIFFRKNSLQKTRLLYCSDRTTENSVQRNRAKRVLRAICRHPQVHFPSGCDIALVSGLEFCKRDEENRLRILKNLMNRFHGE